MTSVQQSGGTTAQKTQKIKPYLWFDRQAEEAATLYTSLFPDSEILHVMRAPADSPGVSAGSVINVAFTLAGQEFIALNGGPKFQFTEAISLLVDCEDQAEVDRLWDALTADGGQESQCGWLKDRFGLSWQIIPRDLPALLGDPEPGRAQRAMEAMLGMRKIDVAALHAAADAA